MKKALEKIKNDQIHIIQNLISYKNRSIKKALYLKDVNVKVYTMLRHLEKVLMRAVTDKTEMTIPLSYHNYFFTTKDNFTD